MGETNTTKFFHYTKLETLDKILRDDRVNFHLSHHNYMNDKGEFIYLETKLKEFLLKYKVGKEVVDFIYNQKNNGYPIGCDNGYYILSFSEHNDELPMWRMYGEECNGVAIGIEATHFVHSSCISTGHNLLNSIISAIGCDNPITFPFHKISYAEKDFIERKSELLCATFMRNKERVVSLFEEIINENAIYIKHPGFKYEDEWRLVLPENSNDGSRNNENVKYKSSRGLLIPYKEFDGLKKEMVKCVVLGPSCDAVRNKKSLRKMLDSRGYAHIEIEVSKIPYSK